MIRKILYKFVFLQVLFVLNLSVVTKGEADFREDGIDDIVRLIINSMEAQNKKKLAVMDFRGLDNSVSGPGMYLSENIVTKLIQTNKFEVIERPQRDRALKEAGFSITEIVDADNTKQVCEILGVDSLVIGSVKDLDDKVLVNGRLMSAETAEVFAVISSEVIKDKGITKLTVQTKTLSPPSQAIKQPLAPKVTLRSSPINLEEDVVGLMIRDHGFFDTNYNHRGDFKNDFEMKVINGVEVVIDKATGLMWQQGGSGQLAFIAGEEYVNNLNKDQFAGFSDWRLPTCEEGVSLLIHRKKKKLPFSNVFSRKKKKLHINDVFSDKQKFIWTSDKRGSDGMWRVYFVYGSIDWYYGFNTHRGYVRSVRTIK